MSNDLSFIKSDVNLKEVNPLDRRQTAVAVNCLIMKLVDCLNDFAQRSEDVIVKCERMLRTADLKLRLLEEKLSNVKPEENEVDNKSNEASKIEEKIIQQLVEPSTSESTDQQLDTPSHEVEDNVDEIPQQTSEDVVLIKNHPQYIKYFKMLKMGVLEQAVKQKMQSEGVDPSILSRGDAPAPKTINTPHSDSDSISSFTDSD